MPTFDDAVADAAELQQAARGLAHALRSMDDPADGYSMLGSLTSGLASLEFVFAQLARFYETTGAEQAAVDGDRSAGRLSAQRVAEQLRASSGWVARAVESVTHAHNTDATIAYTPPLRAPRHASRGIHGSAAKPADPSPTAVRHVEVDGPWL